MLTGFARPTVGTLLKNPTFYDRLSSSDSSCIAAQPFSTLHRVRPHLFHSCINTQKHLIGRHHDDMK